ncbi:MAG: hypothetical protein WBP13_08745 [Methylophilaceae bacterium]
MAGFFVKMLCVLPLAVCLAPRDWDFVQSVGGIAIEQAEVHEGEWSLHVNADVSGLTQITVKPTLINSALICESTDAEVEGDKIFLTINTGVIREGYSSKCPNANLGKIANQTYQVFYKDPSKENHLLGEIDIKVQTGSEWL